MKLVFKKWYENLQTTQIQITIDQKSYKNSARKNLET